MMNRSHVVVTIAVVMLVAAALACGPSAPSPTPVPTETVPPATPTPTLTPTPSGPSLQIINQSGRTITGVYISPTDADEWGENWLTGSVIQDGESYTISGLTPGTYDLRADDESGQRFQIAWEVEIREPVEWVVTGKASLTVVNHSDETIAYLYVSPSDSTEWGENWLDTEVIPSGSSWTLTDIPTGKYDVRVANAAGETIETAYSVSLIGDQTWNVTGVASLPDNAVLRFQDEFDDNRNRWGLFGESENVRFAPPANGEYCILIKSSNHTAWEWYDPFRTREFFAEAVCRVEGAADATCGLGFGPDTENIYWFEVSASDQTFALFLLENGSWQEAPIHWQVSRSINPYGPNALAMGRVGDTIRVYVNGIPVGETSGERFPTGRVGIGGATYDQGNATICIDALYVWQLQ